MAIMNFEYDASSPRDRKPVRQIKHHTGEEARFERTQHETHDIELQRCAHQHQCAFGDAPAEHDAQQRLTCADPVEQQIARNLEHQIADEEYPCADAEYRVAPAQPLCHLKFREADVDAVDIVHAIREKQQRH
jgi:hypothetical protein